MDKIVSTYDLETIAKALRFAEIEIHNPGAARASDYDVLDLVDQAKIIVKRAILFNAAA